MRENLIEDLQGLAVALGKHHYGVSLIGEVIAVLNSYQARHEAGAALKSMLEGGDTPLGKKELSEAFDSFGSAAYGHAYHGGGPQGEIVRAIMASMDAGFRSIADRLSR